MHPIHHNAFVFDAHCDTLGAALPGPEQRDLTQWGETGHLDLPRLRAAGINCQIFACFPGQDRTDACPTSAALRRMEALYSLMERAPGQLSLIQTARDLEQLSAGGPIGAILGLEGSEALDGSIALLHTFYRLGVRNLGLAWEGRNAACDGVGTGSTFGLSPFGREVVVTCNDLGIVLDVSHLNPAGIADVLALSKAPIIASHSNARALCDHPRNLNDDQLRAIAGQGGVIGVAFVDMFLTEDPADATLDHVLDHIDYIANTAGIDHVGLGSDFDGWTLASGLDSGEKYPSLTDGLLARGYSEGDVHKILGANFRRIFSRVLAN